MTQPPLRVLFVCLGNICRSPLAEVVVKSVAQEQGLSEMFHFESISWFLQFLHHNHKLMILLGH